jgi:hypothetical protein
MGMVFIEPGSTWEKGSIERFNGKLRDELLNREIFYTLNEAKMLIEQWMPLGSSRWAAQAKNFTTVM